MVDIQEDGELSRTDDTDRGTEISMRNTADRVKAVRAAVGPEYILDKKGEQVFQIPNAEGVYPIPYCVNPDCCDEIPLARLEMGRIRCTPCQARREPKPKKKP